MLDPTITSPGSIMPAYPWLIDQIMDNSLLNRKMNAMRVLGVPYSVQSIQNASADLQKQADKIAEDLAANQVEIRSDREIIALIAYLQRLGTDIKAEASNVEGVALTEN